MEIMKAAHVSPVAVGSKALSHPNIPGPLAGTIVPSVRPSNRIGSEPAKCRRTGLGSVYLALVLLTWPSRVRECAKSPGSLGGKAGKHRIESLVANLCKKIFNVGSRKAV
jgi:hypothetical protein